MPCLRRSNKILHTSTRCIYFKSQFSLFSYITIISILGNSKLSRTCVLVEIVKIMSIYTKSFLPFFCATRKMKHFYITRNLFCTFFAPREKWNIFTPHEKWNTHTKYEKHSFYTTILFISHITTIYHTKHYITARIDFFFFFFF